MNTWLTLTIGMALGALIATIAGIFGMRAAINYVIAKHLNL